MVNQQAQTKMAKDWLASVEEEEMKLKTKVKRLETYLNNSIPTSIKELQVTLQHTSFFIVTTHKYRKYLPASEPFP